MAKLTDDADYDAGNHVNYYGQRLRTRCVLLNPSDNKTELRERSQLTSINRKKTATIPEITTSWSSYLGLFKLFFYSTDQL
ncbi:unnamed protein product [Protopolystoma xenopodis]|uniref:Uncharacterized protein n=1 Tax=Protopolystoma xenopodis TaxID=117903 RepID=A0A3S5CG05_9PLAT|nr:unnamed protein product [Protopolystoma xenopodis]